MTDETIVAVYDTPAHAELAIQDILAAGVPESAIGHQAGTETTSMTTSADTTQREPGFWASLFGGEPDHNTAVYDRSLASGSSVVTVKTPAAHVDRVMAILESHSPIDIDERATGYDSAYASTTAAPTASPVAPAMQTATNTVAAGQSETIQLAEENLAVGKRVLNRGGTRIRRFVVETPVEESINLHSEKVLLERRPVTDGRVVSDADFSDKTIEMTESVEEAVVSKTARVVEEISLRKEATDHVETIHDTLRREDVEIEQIPGDIRVEETTRSGNLDTHAPKI